MILDILFNTETFILERPLGVIGGAVQGLSFDGNNYNFLTGATSGSEYSSIFIS